jgi:hypothetical protein
MANLDHFVQVTVTKTSASVTQQGFGRPLWLGLVSTSIIPGRYATFSSPSELLTAGAAVTDPVYLWAQTLQGQSQSPIDFAVGRRDITNTISGVGAAQVETITIDTADAGVWPYVLDGVTYSYTADGDDTALTIAQGLMDLILADDASLTANGNAIKVPGGTLVSASFTATAWVAGEAFVGGTLVPPGSGAVTITATTANAAVEEIDIALNAVVAENDDWYGLNIESRQDADILLANTWVASQLKVLVTQSSDADVLTTAGGDIGSQLGATSNTRTQLMWHYKPKQFADGAMLGRALAAKLDEAAPGAGQITWLAKQLKVIFSNPLNTNQLTNLEANNSDTFTTTKGRGVVWLGQSVEGEFMDVQTTLDWLQSRIGEAVFTPIATTPTKLGFDNAGIAVVKTAVNSVMIQGVENAHLLGDDPASPSVTVPKSTDVSTADRNSRTLNNVIANGIIQGAIHRVNVQVNVAA